MFKIVGERSTAKNYSPVNLLSVVSVVSDRVWHGGLLPKFKFYGI